MKLRLNKKSNLLQRVVAGSLGAFMIITSIWLSEWSYFVVFGLIAGFAQWEFYKLLDLKESSPLRYFGLFVGFFMYSIVFLIQKQLLPYQFILLIFISFFCVFLIKLYRIENQPFVGVAFTFLGVIYAALPFSLLHIVVWPFGGRYCPEIITGILVLLWASDSGAYFAGTAFGKTRLFERISPKKSWEGSLGGLLLSLFTAYLLSGFFPVLALSEWIILAIIIVVAGTYGDLVESLFKRSLRIKDSGNTIPGHGGFLDRFDGLLISAPFIVAYLVLKP